jgi:chloramphenicol O-acetyltransferase type B
MITWLTQRMRQRRYRAQYPGATIALWAHASDSILGSGCELLGDAAVRESTIGAEVTVKHGARLTRATVGDYVVVGPDVELTDATVGSYSYLTGDSTVRSATFGRFCSIGRQLLAGLGEHPSDRMTTSPLFFSTSGQCNITFADEDEAIEHRPITVGNDVWIGARVFLRDGVTIGHGAIIAAGAVVVADVPDYAAVGGVPAKVIRYRFDETVIPRLLELAWWQWDEPRLREARPQLASADVEGFIEWATNR